MLFSVRAGFNKKKVPNNRLHFGIQKKYVLKHDKDIIFIRFPSIISLYVEMFLKRQKTQNNLTIQKRFNIL